MIYVSYGDVRRYIKIKRNTSVPFRKIIVITILKVFVDVCTRVGGMYM